MTIALAFWLGALGLYGGSFLNVVIHRIRQERHYTASEWCPGWSPEPNV